MTSWKNDFFAMFGNRFFCFAWLVFGLGYVTWFGFLKNPMDFTASMIGLDYPKAFKMWAAISIISIAVNVLYMYRRYGYAGRAGKICMAIGACSLAATVHIPSTEIMSVQLVAHWSTALLFAILNAVALGMFLLHVGKRNRRMMLTFVLFIALLVVMLVWLATGKNGVQEKLPIWGSYIILFLVNFTGIYGVKEERKEALA